MYHSAFCFFRWIHLLLTRDPLLQTERMNTEQEDETWSFHQPEEIHLPEVGTMCSNHIFFSFICSFICSFRNCPVTELLSAISHPFEKQFLCYLISYSMELCSPTEYSLSGNLASISFKSPAWQDQDHFLKQRSNKDLFCFRLLDFSSNLM